MQMANIAIYTAPGFTASSWTSAFGQPHVVTFPDTNIQTLQAFDVVLIHSARQDWQNLITQLHTAKHVIVISQQLSLAELQLALTLGAKGYLDAGSSSAHFIQSVSSVRNGALWLPASLLNQLNQFFSQVIAPKTDWASFESRLSKREYEVASFARKGLSNKDIAASLNITERTVKQHLTATFAKLGIKDRLQLILLL